MPHDLPINSTTPDSVFLTVTEDAGRQLIVAHGNGINGIVPLILTPGPVHSGEFAELQVIRHRLAVAIYTRYTQLNKGRDLDIETVYAQMAGGPLFLDDQTEDEQEVIREILDEMF